MKDFYGYEDAGYLLEDPEGPEHSGFLPVGYIDPAFPVRFMAGIDQTEEDFDFDLKPGVLWQTFQIRGEVSLELIELLTGMGLIPLCERQIPSEGTE